MSNPSVALAALALLLAPPWADAASQPGLAFVEAYVDDKNGGAFLSNARFVVVAPDGLQLHVTSAEGVALFGRDTETGALSPAGALPKGSHGVTAFGVMRLSDDGAFAYVTDNDADGLSVWQRDTVSGTLTFVQHVVDDVGGVDGLETPQSVALSPDQAHVYATGSGDSAVAVFSRDPGTGVLTFVEHEEQGVGGVDGLVFARGVAASPDGANVYVTGPGTDAIAVFSRDAVTGELTFVESHHDGMGGVDGLDGANGVAVTPDGLDVYVGGALENRVAMFRRSLGTGMLTFNGTVVTGSAANVVAVSDTLVYGVSSGTTLFERDPATGLLTILEAHANGVRGVEGVDGGGSLAQAPDGRHVYMNGFFDSAVALFQTTSITCSATPAVGCRTVTSPGKTLLKIKDREPDDKDKGDSVVWKWARGTATSIGEFGTDPTASTEYALCLYDSSANPQPIHKFVVPPGNNCPKKACWKVPGSGTKYIYKDKAQTPDGVVSMKMAAGAEGKASVVAKAKGANIEGAFAEPFGLPLTAPVVMQLQSSEGECWTSTFASPILNDATQFRGKGD